MAKHLIKRASTEGNLNIGDNINSAGNFNHALEKYFSGDSSTPVDGDGVIKFDTSNLIHEEDTDSKLKPYSSTELQLEYLEDSFQLVLTLLTYHLVSFYAVIHYRLP